MKAKMVHVCFEVSDLDRAVAFYGKAFELQEAERMTASENGEPYKLAYMKDSVSGMELELFAWAERDAIAPVSEREIHFAVVVDDIDSAHAEMQMLTDDVDPVMTELSADGADTETGRYFFVRDPDGNAIEVMQRMGRYQ